MTQVKGMSIQGFVEVLVREDHGHYFGAVGCTIRFSLDGSGEPVLEYDDGFQELERITALHKENDNAVAGGETCEQITTQFRSKCEAVVSHYLKCLQVVSVQGGELSTLEGEPYIKWVFDPKSLTLKRFLSQGLSFAFDGEVQSLLDECRARHSFETELLFTSSGWSYETWSGTMLTYEKDMNVDTDQIKVYLPLGRVAHQDGRPGYHYSLLVS